MMGLRRKLFYLSGLLITASSLTWGQGEGDSDSFKKFDTDSYIGNTSKPTTTDVNLDYSSTVAYIQQIKSNEEKVICGVDKILQKKVKKLHYQPATVLKDLRRELKKQKKILEQNLKNSGNDLESQVEAFGNFNKYLIISFNRSDIKEVLEFYHNLMSESDNLVNSHKQQMSTNPLLYIFHDKSYNYLHSKPAIKNVIKIKKHLVKLRSLLIDKKRENEILKKEYKGFGSSFRKFKDRLSKKGTYAKSKKTEEQES